MRSSEWTIWKCEQGNDEKEKDHTFDSIPYIGFKLGIISSECGVEDTDQRNDQQSQRVWFVEEFQ